MPSPKCAAILGAIVLPFLGAAIPTAPAPAQAQAPAAACAPVPSAGQYPTWEKLPKQTTLPDPWLPLAYTTTDSEGGSSPNFASDVMAGKGKNRIQTPEEWYQCRQPEILQMLQEYQ